MSKNPISSDDAIQEVEVKKPIPYIRTLYFFAVILPYVFATYSIFSTTSYTAVMQMALSMVLGISWHLLACPLFYKKLADPYQDNLIEVTFILFQYVFATLALHFLVTYLSLAQV